MEEINSIHGIRPAVRDARVILPWLPEEQALRLLSQDPALGEKENRLELFRSALDAMRGRPSQIDQTDVVMDPPAVLTPYIEKLNAHPATEQFRKEGWIVRVANLRKLCCVQPAAFLDHAIERTRDADKDDLLSLARITLPLEVSDTDFSTSYDEPRNRFVLTSRNPNFRVAGAYQSKVPSRGQTGLATGFVNMTQLSLLQVAYTRGRYLLRDGNHRALGLLQNNIEVVPVLFKRYGDHQNVSMSAGLLPPDVYLGERPPVLPDYLDDSVSVRISLPIQQKVVIVQAIETWITG
jgi:hypothetical protein